MAEETKTIVLHAAAVLIAAEPKDWPEALLVLKKGMGVAKVQQLMALPISELLQLTIGDLGSLGDHFKK